MLNGDIVLVILEYSSAVWEYLDRLTSIREEGKYSYRCK